MTDASDRHRYVLEQPSVRPAGAPVTTTGVDRSIRRSATEDIGTANRSLRERDAVQASGNSRGCADGSRHAGALRLRSRDLAKIGQLVLNGGVWNNYRIVSKVGLTSRPVLTCTARACSFYGYQWWLGRSLVSRQEIKWISAVGGAVSACTSCQAEIWLWW